jgi:Holliday junction resolvasome RuvABC endonuclease subunit
MGYVAHLVPDGRVKNFQQVRRAWWRDHLPEILNLGGVDAVACEDYAYAASQGAHQIGEIGGLLRLALWDSGVPWRLYTTHQIKIFATGRGRAEKHEMIAAAAAVGCDFSSLVPPKTQLTIGAEDAADAHAIARLLQTELLLRSGRLQVSSLDRDVRGVFTSVGKRGTTLLDEDMLSWKRK